MKWCYYKKDRCSVSQLYLEDHPKHWSTSKYLQQERALSQSWQLLYISYYKYHLFPLDIQVYLSYGSQPGNKHKNTITKLLFVRCEIRSAQCESAFLISGPCWKWYSIKSNSTTKCFAHLVLSSQYMCNSGTWKYDHKQ